MGTIGGAFVVWSWGKGAEVILVSNSLQSLSSGSLSQQSLGQWQLLFLTDLFSLDNLLFSTYLWVSSYIS